MKSVKTSKTEGANVKTNSREQRLTQLRWGSPQLQGQGTWDGQLDRSKNHVHNSIMQNIEL